MIHMNLLQMSLYGGLFILIVIILRGIAVNRLPKTTFLVLWYIALIRMLLPITFRSSIRFRMPADDTASIWDAFEGGITNTVSAVLSDRPESIMDKATEGFQSNRLWFQGDVPHALPMIWAIGTAVTAIFFIVSYLRCRHEFRAALPMRNDFTSLWLREHPLRRTIAIRQLTGLSTPLVYGLFRPVILMPKETDWKDACQMRYILFHEYVHIRRFDGVSKLLAASALCVHWFNPLAWAFYILFNRDIELSCDERVLRHFSQKKPKDYAMALIRMESGRNRPASLGNYFSKNATEERIKAIMKFRRKTPFALASAVIVIAAAAAAALSLAPEAKNADYHEILTGEGSFLYVSEGAALPRSISDVPSLFDPYDDYMKIWACAEQDLDGDGNSELILSVYGASGDMGGNLILHRIGNKVYGYAVDHRAMTNLKTDGTYSYSDPTGMAEAGICSMGSFSETGYTVHRISYACGTQGQWDTFVVNQRPATEEEFLAAEEEQGKKPATAWSDFSAEPEAYNRR